jgi:putative oxidoreductase
MGSLSSNQTRLSWVGQLVGAGLLGSTTFFKLTGAPESIDLFTELGVEPWGRIGLGIVEVIASLLLLIPRTAAFGGVMVLGLMSGAIFSHLTVLGIVFHDDGGSLFMMAVIIFAASAMVTWLRRREIPVIGSRFA